MGRGILRYSLFRGRANLSLTSWRLHSITYRQQLKLTQNASKRSYSTTNTLRKEKAVEVVAGTPYKDLTVGVPKEMWPKEKR